MNHKKGIHHITILAGDPLQNADFYVNTLGIRTIPGLTTCFTGMHRRHPAQVSLSSHGQMPCRESPELENP